MLRERTFKILLLECFVRHRLKRGGRERLLIIKCSRERVIPSSHLSSSLGHLLFCGLDVFSYIFHLLLSGVYCSDCYVSLLAQVTFIPVLSLFKGAEPYTLLPPELISLYK